LLQDARGGTPLARAGGRGRCLPAIRLATRLPAPPPRDDGGSVNLETLYGAIDDEALAVRIPKHARKELEAYLECGLLCRG